MSAWSLTAAAVAAGLTAGAAQQSPTIVQARPARASVLAAPAVQVEARKVDSQRVSVDFNHATVADVLDWLSKNNTSFVAADSEIPKDATVTMSIKDEPIDDVADAIATALGGHWEMRGNVHVFRKGEGFEVFGRNGRNFFPAPPALPGEPGRMRSFNVPDVPMLAPDMGEWKGPDMDKLRAELKDVPGMDEQSMKEMEESLREAQKEMEESGVATKESRKATEEALREAQKEMEESGVANRESRKAMEESLREARKQMEESGVATRESRKAMEQARRAIEKARREHPEAFNGKTFLWTPDDKSFNYKFVPNAPIPPRMPAFRDRMNRMRISVDKDMTKLLDSLTPDQREMNRRQGYLRPSDLTPAQRKMINLPDKGNWTIKISKDGQDLTIKSGD